MPMDEKMIISSDILSDTADAIRNRGGTNSTIKPINFATNITNLPNVFTVSFERATPNGTITASRTGATFSAIADANGNGTLYLYGAGTYSIVDNTSGIIRGVSFSETNSIGFRVIPDGYQQVEYLQNTGSGYINTGITSSADLGIDLMFSLDTVSTSGAIFGGRATQLTNTYTLFFLNTPRFRFDADGQKEIATANNMLFDTISMYHFVHDAVQHYVNVTNTTSGDSATTTSIHPSTYTNFPICLFGVNTNGTIGTFSLSKIYSCSFYESGIETHRFIPCYRKANNKPGMYDSIIEEFYPSQGNTELVCGPDVN